MPGIGWPRRGDDFEPLDANGDHLTLEALQKYGESGLGPVAGAVASAAGLAAGQVGQALL